MLETIDFAASLDIFDGSYSKLSAKLNRTLEQAWPLAEAGDPLPLALHVASQTFLQTAAPELYAAATEVSKDPTSESAVEALEAEIIGFLEDASFLLGSVNLPTCCAPEGLQANA